MFDKVDRYPIQPEMMRPDAASVAEAVARLRAARESEPAESPPDEVADALLKCIAQETAAEIDRINRYRDMPEIAQANAYAFALADGRQRLRQAGVGLYGGEFMEIVAELSGEHPRKLYHALRMKRVFDQEIIAHCAVIELPWRTMRDMTTFAKRGRGHGAQLAEVRDRLPATADAAEQKAFKDWLADEIFARNPIKRGRRYTSQNPHTGEVRGKPTTRKAAMKRAGNRPVVRVLFPTERKRVWKH